MAELASARAIWEEGLASEIQFWDKWFSTKGGKWPADYAMRLDPQAPLQEHWARYLDHLTATELSVLDVGAGPLTKLGKIYKGRRLRMLATDALADVYDVLLERHGVVPPVRTTWCEAELLSHRFQPQTFDLVTAINCLDHSHDPRAAILQAFGLVKVGCYLRLRHAPNEAEHEQYVGLHQWNFVNEDGRFVLWNRTARIDMTALLSPVAEITMLHPAPNPDVAILKLREYVP
ncbi:MAG: class I SAM-dependent methyltransferase [Acidobacteria bacterium]|nr:class I SAM-dependent methyltransferase [Acidobacteriota bacterium]